MYISVYYVLLLWHVPTFVCITDMLVTIRSFVLCIFITTTTTTTTVFMAALWNRAAHYIFMLWFLSIFYLFFLTWFQWPHIGCLPYFDTWCGLCKFRMQVWNVLCAARWKRMTQKIAKNWSSGHHRTTLSGYIFATKAHIDNRKKNFLSSNISSTCPHNMVNFSQLAAEIGPVVWGTPANFNGFRVLAALLHGTVVVDVSQTLWRWTEGTTYIRQGSHHVGHWPTL